MDYVSVLRACEALVEVRVGRGSTQLKGLLAHFFFESLAAPSTLDQSIPSEATCMLLCYVVYDMTVPWLAMCFASGEINLGKLDLSDRGDTKHLPVLRVCYHKAAQTDRGRSARSFRGYA